MNSNAQALLKAFLSTSKYGRDLLPFLPARDSKEIQGVELGGPFEPSSFLSPSQWSQPIHFSWFLETIKEYPNSVKYLFLNALPAAQAEAIEKTLTAPEERPKASPFLNPFLLHVLRKNLKEPEILDEPLLPPSTLNLLLRLERKYLFHLPDLLGLYDLAADLRQVVDKGLLKKVQSALSPEQQRFLSDCSKQSIKWVPPKLGLISWNGSAQQLKSLLHYRGLIRLAKAIFREDLSFRWHLLHRMDTGRAKIIQKEFYQKQDPALVPYFKNQVLHIAQRYKA